MYGLALLPSIRITVRSVWNQKVAFLFFFLPSILGYTMRNLLFANLLSVPAAECFTCRLHLYCQVKRSN